MATLDPIADTHGHISSDAVRPDQESGRDSPLIVFVCTANQCRSPLAEALARREFDRLGVNVRLTSMGFLDGGAPAPQRGLRIAAEHGLDLSGHRSRELDPKTLTRATLVLTMTRRHARELVVKWPALWPRVFTIKQFSGFVHERPAIPGWSVEEWVATTSAQRERTELLGSSEADDTVDPMGRSVAVWRRVVDELDQHLRTIASACAPLMSRSMG